MTEPKSKMTVPHAAKVFREKKPKLDKLQAEVDQAKEVLKAYFRRTNKSEYRGLIAYALTFQNRFDFEKLRSHLGTREPEFKSPIPIETVSIIPRGLGRKVDRGG